MIRTLALALIALLLAACGAGAPATATPPAATATPSPVVPADVQALAAQACEEADFPRCVEVLNTAARFFPGELVVVCDFGDGTGDVVRIDDESGAAAACATYSDSARVVTTVRLP